MTERLPDYTDTSFYLGYDVPASPLKDASIPPLPGVKPELTVMTEGSNTSFMSGVWSEDGMVSGTGDYVPFEHSDYAASIASVVTPEQEADVSLPAPSEPVKPESIQPEFSGSNPVGPEVSEEPVISEPEGNGEETAISSESSDAPAEAPAAEPEKQTDLRSVAAMLATAQAVKTMTSGSTAGLSSKVENRNTKQAVGPVAPNRSGERPAPSRESRERKDEKARPEDLVIPPRRTFAVPDEYGFYLSAKKPARYATAPSGATRNEYVAADLINTLLGSIFGDNAIGSRNEQLRDPLEGYPDHQFARDIVYHEAGLIDTFVKAQKAKDPDSSLARKELARRNELLRLVDKAVIDRDGIDLNRVAIVYDRVQRLKAEKEARGEDFTARRLTRMYARAQQRADRELASEGLASEQKQGLEAMKERARIALMFKRPDGTYPFL